MSLEARAVEISFENMFCRVLRTVGCLSVVRFLTYTGIDQNLSNMCFTLVFESLATSTKIYLNHFDNILFRLSTIINHLGFLCKS